MYILPEGSRCPVCGAFRIIYETEDIAICVDRCCPIYGETMPIAIKTDKEALTYLGWIPEKYRIGYLDGYRYFNPKLYRDKAIKTGKQNALATTRV